MLIEIQDESESKGEYLSSSNGIFSWENIYHTNQLVGLNKMAMNDPSEIFFGGITYQLQCFGQICLSHVGAVGPVRVIEYLSSCFDAL